MAHTQKREERERERERERRSKQHLHWTERCNCPRGFGCDGKEIVSHWNGEVVVGIAKGGLGFHPPAFVLIFKSETDPRVVRG